MSYETILYEVEDGILTITLNRPEKLNAFTVTMMNELIDAFDRADADDAVRAVIVTGAGRAFCAGADLSAGGKTFDYEARGDRPDKQGVPLLPDGEPDLGHESVRDGGGRVSLRIFECLKPVIAAVNGPAVGLGCSLVALSDISFMAESAHLADPHVAVGLVAADGGPVTWPLLTSLQLAKEYAFTGDRIPAARAAEIGLVNHVCSDDEVVGAAMACARKIAALPPGAVRDTKRIMNLHLERAVVATLDFALSAEHRSFDAPELRANIDRFLAPRERKTTGEGTA